MPYLVSWSGRPVQQNAGIQQDCYWDTILQSQRRERKGGREREGEKERGDGEERGRKGGGKVSGQEGGGGGREYLNSVQLLLSTQLIRVLSQ